MLQYTVECPSCHKDIHIPFMKALEAKAIEEFDMLERDAQEELSCFQKASLWQLLRFWWEREHV